MRPQPSPAELDDLVAGYRAAGLSVRVEIAGEPRDLPSGVELPAYRVIEEALTNPAPASRQRRLATCRWLSIP